MAICRAVGLLDRLRFGVEVGRADGLLVGVIVAISDGPLLDGLSFGVIVGMAD